MTLYSQNPNLKFKTVTTVNGETEYRKNTKFIKNQYYIINKDCFEVDGNWYRKDGGIIVFDEEKKEWLKKKDKHLFHGIVNFENGKPVMGYFSTNLYNNCMVRSDEYGTVPAINTKILLDNGYFEDIGLGIWYNRKSVTPSTYKRMITIRNEKSYTDRGYNIEDNPSDFQQKIQSFKDYPMKLSKNVTSYAKLLGSTTFGAEIEVAKGYLPDHIQNRTSIVVCRDGSIGGGPEFVTTPLSGAKGLQNLPIIAEEVSKRCEVDINCSFHLHLGGVQDDRSFIVSMYVLALKLQDEMFKMFPYYKTDPTGVKKKNYNNKLKKMSIHPLLDCSKDGYNAYIEDVYNKIFKFLSDGVDANESYNRISRRHPVSQKWNRSSRFEQRRLI